MSKTVSERRTYGPAPTSPKQESSMTTARTVTVFGAYGHTGRFVVAELRRRGWTPIVSGRDPAKLRAVEAAHPGVDVRLATIDEPASLDAAVAGAAAVINCAGPFAETAAPVVEAALRARIPYLDVAAEIEANADTFERFAGAAREAGVLIVPAMAFFGGLGDLLAAAAMGDWDAADEISIAYGLDSWRPTSGTLAAGRVSRQRRDGRRIVFADGRFEHRTDAAPTLEWTFPPPVRRQPVVGEFTMADTLTISRHLRVPQIRSYMTRTAVEDLTAPDASPPDGSGRSSQTFLVEVVARRGDQERRAVARGRDIYAISAPLVVEATQRLVGRKDGASGARSAGEAFDAPDFLGALSPEHLRFEMD
jgi:NAD(P)-dependent dehydrogenase (short-subunit alcohol dehydrogenase family)